jgi:hypothetical protein
MVCIAVVTRQIVRWYQIFCPYDLKKFPRPSVDRCHFCNGVTKFRNTTVSLIMPTQFSVCPHAMKNLSRNFSRFLEKSHYNINISLQSDNNSQCFTADRFTFVVSSGWIFLTMRKFFRRIQRELKHTFSIQNVITQNFLHCSSLKLNSTRLYCTMLLC